MLYDLEVTDLLENCLDNGFEPSLYLIALGANGSIIVARYAMENEDLKPIMLTEYIESEGFRVPMNIVIVDIRGQAAPNVDQQRRHQKADDQLGHDPGANHDRSN
jgi:hypothetical protein